MKKSMTLPVALGLSLAVLACLRHSARLAGETRLDPPAKGAIEFTNGQWFDGQNFQRRTFYSVDGTLTSKKPLRVDEVIDLKNGYVAKRTATLLGDNLRFSNSSAWYSRICRGPKRSGEHWKRRAKSSTVRM
jgi:hypothetical protein